MTVNEIKPNILCLEYRQDKNDEDYGTCLWARFTFNLDRYEMTIISDCGNYGYKWIETPNSESFLELMARCEKEYILDKIYRSADIFDYDETKKYLYECYCHDEEDKAKLNSIFENIEWNSVPDTADDFIRKFDCENDGYFNDAWGYEEFIQYRHPTNVVKIASVFDKCIKPKIKEILKK